MIRAIRIADDVQDEPIFINDERDPLASLDQRTQKSAQPCTGNAVGSGNGQIGIGQNRKFQVVFLLKLALYNISQYFQQKNFQNSQLVLKVCNHLHQQKKV